MKRYCLFLVVLMTAVACSTRTEMDRYIDGLMDNMTIEQKIGQLNLHSAGGFISAEKVMEDDQNVKLLRAGQLGGL